MECTLFHSEIEKLIEVGFFKEIDLAFAKIFEKKVSKESLFFLSYLFAKARLGNHSVLAKEAEIFQEADGYFENSDSIKKALCEGARALPETICQKAHDLVDLRPIVKDGSNFFLQKYFHIEDQIAKEFANLLVKEKKEMGHVELDTSVLNQDQKKAIEKSLSHSVFVLSGGPGTGKTHTIRHLIQAYLANHAKESIKILACAPTGKATSHLREKLSSFKEVEVLTLHRALNIKRSKVQNASQFLVYDLIVVDECSMIDLSLWRLFLQSLTPQSNVVLVGDYHQLPPVETGMIFEELFLTAPHVELKECLRIESPEIHALAESIRNHDKEKALYHLKTPSDSLSYSTLDIRSNLFNLKGIDVEKEFAHFLDPTLTPKQLLEKLGKVCILTPLNKGAFGTKVLNEAIDQCLRERVKNSKRALPILLTKTDYERGLSNGDLGVLIQDLSNPLNHRAYFCSEGELVEYPPQLLPSYELAFAVSVHKSQGSEFEKVIVLLPEKSELFGKEILYTAITRAKKECRIFAAEGVIERCFLTERSKTQTILNRIKHHAQNLNLEEKTCTI